MKRRFRTGGLATWSINHPIAVSMLALTVIVIGLFSFDQLKIDLLPKLIYPEIRISVRDPGVPAQIIEDQITRQLEEQLAITEGAVSIQSNTTQGRTSISLSFSYDMDIDVALREASTRLDRAKRFLPGTIDPPTIYKRDPSQIPVLELIVSSSERNSVQLRSWTDYEFSKWFLNVPGVAATEVGGGLIREIQIIIDQEKLAAAGFIVKDVIDILKRENIDISSGTLYMQNRQFSTRTEGRFKSINDIANLPLISSDNPSIDNTIRLGDVATILDTHKDEVLRIRLNNTPGIKLSIQKQPTANTVTVVDNVLKRLEWFKQQKLLPEDIKIAKVGDQSTYVRHSLRNASIAALSGALLAMLVVYVFLGDIRRTLIISTAIPLAILVTLSIMNVAGLTLNIMSLGGLALGVGILVDNTIVMLENISRHQSEGKDSKQSAMDAAAEVASAITASTTTNLVAVLPFLFIGGLIGLLFSELIITLSAAIIASLVVALTLIPALGAQIPPNTDASLQSSHFFNKVQSTYVRLLEKIINKPAGLFIVIFPLLFYCVHSLYDAKNIFFPPMDEGQISVYVSAEPGTRLEKLDLALIQLETLFQQQNEVETVFTTSGGFVFGRSEYQRSNRGSIIIQLKTLSERGNIESRQWVRKMRKEIEKLNLTGIRAGMHVRGIRGVRLGRGDDDISIRVQGDDLDKLQQTGDRIIDAIKDIPGISNLQHSYEEIIEELVLNIDRERAADLGIYIDDISRALSIALSGKIASNYIEGDQQFDIRIRLDKNLTRSSTDIENIIVSVQQGKVIRLIDVANIEMRPTASSIKRDNQRRIVEVSGSLKNDADIQSVMKDIYSRINEINLPEGYSVYDGGLLNALRENEKTSYVLMALALFFVFVVMAVQYESLINPMIIILGVPFTLIGVDFGVELFLQHKLTMPAKIGIIMLAGIVVNNAIVLVEQIEIQKEKGQKILNATIEAARLRLRPILMTTLTTVMGMMPLSIGLGEGSEMLQPMATVIVFGLSFSMLVSLFIIPIFYNFFHRDST